MPSVAANGNGHTVKGDKYYAPYYTEVRPLVGYGLSGTPDPQWPKGAKIAISWVINWEEGGERSVAHGDDESENYIIEKITAPTVKGGRDLSTESEFEYGSRVGMPRLVRLFRKYNQVCTMYLVAGALRACPYLGPILVESGFEIASHGNRWLQFLGMDPEEEMKHINESIDTYQELCGDKTVPKGWFIGRRSNQSQRLYARAAKERGLDFSYSSDSYGDDLPYWLPSPLADEGEKDEGMLIVPYSLDNNDWKFDANGSGWSTGDDFYKYLVDSFDVLYAEGEKGKAKMMSIGLHCRAVGRPGRVSAIEKFMKYIASKPDVWITTRHEIATHWKSKFPYNPATAEGVKRD